MYVVCIVYIYCITYGDSKVGICYITATVVVEDDRSRASNTSKNSMHTIKAPRSRAPSTESAVQQGSAPQKPPQSTTTTNKSRTRVPTRPSFDDSDEENDVRRDRTAEGKKSVSNTKNEEEEVGSVGSEYASKGDKDGQLYSAHSLDSSRSDDAT